LKTSGKTMVLRGEKNGGGTARDTAQLGRCREPFLKKENLGQSLPKRRGGRWRRENIGQRKRRKEMITVQKGGMHVG